MTKKQITKLLLTTMVVTSLFGCASKSKSSKPKEEDSTSKTLITSAFKNFNKESIREITIAETDGSTETTYTYNEDLSAYLETGSKSNDDGSFSSTSRILSSESGTNYVYAQDDAFLEDGTVNELASFTRTQDTENDYKYCESLLTLTLSDTVNVSEATEDTVDGIACSKITVSDPNNGKITYWVDSKTLMPVKLESGTTTTSYRTGESNCMGFEIPQNYSKG